ncbi:hypothetical protein Tco_0919928 [Tanacetum coccineum]
MSVTEVFEIIVLSSDSSDYSKGVPEKGPSIQGLLDWYGYNTIKEYLSDTYFPSTYKDTTNKDSTNEDTILECYSPMSKANDTTWDDILKKNGVRKPEIYAYKAKGKRKVAGKHLQVAGKHLHVSLHFQLASKHLQLEGKHLQVASKHLQLVSKHLQLASKHLQVSLHFQLAFATCKQAFIACKQAFAAYTLLNYPFACIFTLPIRLHLQLSPICLHLLTYLLALTHLLALAATNVFTICLHLH